MVLALPLAACVHAPATEPHRAPVTPPAAFAGIDGAAPEQAVPFDHWWTLWGDPALDAQVERTLAANQDIRIAMARVRAARAMAAVAESALYPTIAANGAVWGTVANGTIDGSLGQLLAASPEGASGTAGGGHVVALGAAWEPDVFGGRHADRDAARAAALGTQDMAAGVRLMVVADVVENWQQAAGLARRLILLDRSLSAADTLIMYARARMAAGQSDAATVAKVEAARAGIAAQRGPLVELIAIRQRRLAVLAGDPPEKPVAVPAESGLTLPAVPTGELPSTVLARRPDVRATAAAVAARAARLKSLKRDLLPRFNVLIGGADGHVTLAGIPGYGGQAGLIGLQASVPLFTAGRLHARIVGGDADLDAALAMQDRTVLAALEDVEAATSLRHGADQSRAQRERAGVESNRRLVATDALFRAGRKTLGDVLEARLDALSAADAVEQAQIAQGSATVQLYRALGGGWDGAGTVSPAPAKP
ncbi:RND efflux system outer membrane lipoprotein [Novosphingobium nitrogenifigens DSM 19370]|uniref:RND efflux system outer membrane lipoprotein n=2 Tax=Novosphingobium nitrogenifigens TaxID=378548 RepID=F1Z6E0_9SPHN|nr:RND efflux system outer membrane lipoprotein [Novosphingobium nitrogenifigens DSM 19370]